MSIKINSLLIENTKRIKAVKIEPNENGLTVVGGGNNQGKTSVLDAIAWALGGNKLKPSEPQRKGSSLPPNIKIELSNGLVVERSGKNSDLKVIDPSGNRSGQALLDSFISELALNVPKFIESDNKSKAKTLLNIIGVGDSLYELDSKESQLFNKRRDVGTIAKQKRSHADEMRYYDSAPDELINVQDLLKSQQDAYLVNESNRELRRERDDLKVNNESLHRQLEELKVLVEGSDKELAVAELGVTKLIDIPLEEIELKLSTAEETNEQVRSNIQKRVAEKEAKEYEEKYSNLTSEIEDVRRERLNLLNDAELPLPELSVEDGELTYKGFKWDNMSSSQQLKVATAIVRKIQPNCGFVLLDKLEQFDLDQLNDFGQWLQAEGLQAIATRVSTGDECEIIISDGYIVGQDNFNVEEVKEETNTQSVWD